ncbi:MAG: hypothetical protein HFF73_02615 [Oscillospiraceae bacterium]|nr:hypothetical protein [Oscillospiraceae bacterium]
MKKRILALLLTLCMALTLLPGMALAAEGENPQPVVVRTAEELRAAMETESIVSLANNIDLRNVTINPAKDLQLALNGRTLSLASVKVTGPLMVLGGTISAISDSTFTAVGDYHTSLTLVDVHVGQISNCVFSGALELDKGTTGSTVDVIDSCEIKSNREFSIDVGSNCQIGRITNNTIVNNPAEGESIAIRIYHGNIGTIGRISGNKITANTHAIFISNNSTLECLAENGIYCQDDQGSVFIENDAKVGHLHVRGNWMKNPHHEGMWLYQTVDGWTIGRHDAVNSAEIAPYTPDCEESDSDYINILKSENGEIIPSLRHAEAGERVTLNVHPDKGYELDELTVTDRRGRNITLRALGDSAYTFLMPNVRVTVEATFKAIKDATTPETTDPADEEFNGLGTPGISGIVLNPAAMPYTDVKGPDWFYNNVEYMWKHYLMSGVSDTQFAPNTTTNRGMIWTILARMNNVRTDINPGSTWYEKGMLWCKEQGITDGTNPLSDITREQLVTMLWRNAGKQSGNGDLSKFSDSADVSEYAVTAMRWAVGNGILNGENGQINPQGTATRAQVAAMVARYGDKIVR